MKKIELFLGFLVITFSIGLFVLNRRMAQDDAPPQPQAATMIETEVPLPPIVFAQTNSAAPAKAVASQSFGIPPVENTQLSATSNEMDPEALDALALVGVDPDADEFWMDAIFDTSLPDNERGDLMEDLNEAGFADPKNPTADDLPLILSRLQIIEQIMPEADPFMRDHLAEAYKDLGDMYTKVSGQ